MVEVARRGKQLGEVHGFAAAAVEFVDLGKAAESVGEDYRARLGFPQPGQQGAFAQASLTSPWQTWKPELPARLQQPVSRHSAWAPAAVRSFSSASQPSTACWWQCTWMSTDAPRWQRGGRFRPARGPHAGPLGRPYLHRQVRHQHRHERGHARPHRGKCGQDKCPGRRSR